MADLPIKTIVILAMAVLVMLALSAFLYGEAGGQIDTANANKVFSQYCNAYRSNNCAWSATEEEGFDKFVGACQEIHGRQNLAFSCLYKFCCNEQKGMCEGLCAVCQGHKYSGVSQETINNCISDYNGVCATPCELPS